MHNSRERRKHTLAAVLGEGQLHESNYCLNNDSIRQAAQALGSHKAALLPNTRAPIACSKWS
jgi:hypothetical protein